MAAVASRSSMSVQPSSPHWMPSIAPARSRGGRTRTPTRTRDAPDIKSPCEVPMVDWREAGREGSAMSHLSLPAQGVF